MKKLKKKQIREVKRFSEYMVSGGAQFWSGYGAYAVLDIVFHVPFWPARILSYVLGVSVNFILERFWVFNGRKLSKRQIETSAQRFYSLMFVNFLLDMLIVGALWELGISPYIGQFISAGFFTVWNYLLFKFWVFQKSRSPKKRSVTRRKYA